MFRILLTALQLATHALAVFLAYTTYKYNCLNVGPCYKTEGSSTVNFWIVADEIAMFSFLVFWAGLLIATNRFCLAPIGRNAKAVAWTFATFTPPIVFFLADWWFHRGFPLPPV